MTTFLSPRTKSTLTLCGRRGLMELSSGFCQALRASVKLDGQNGKIFDTTPVVASSCPGKHRSAHASSRTRR